MNFFPQTQHNVTVHNRCWASSSPLLVTFGNWALFPCICWFCLTCTTHHGVLFATKCRRKVIMDDRQITSSSPPPVTVGDYNPPWPFVWKWILLVKGVAFEHPLLLGSEDCMVCCEYECEGRDALSPDNCSSPCFSDMTWFFGSWRLNAWLWQN